MGVEVFFQNGPDAPGFLTVGKFDSGETDEVCVRAVAQLGTVAGAEAWVDGDAPDGLGAGRLLGSVSLGDLPVPSEEQVPWTRDADPEVDVTVEEPEDGDEPDAAEAPAAKPARKRSSK